MLKRTWQIIYMCISMGVLTMGFIFEEPYSNRRTFLLLLMGAYLVALLFSLFIAMGPGLNVLLALIMVSLLLLIEVNSKYAVNYFLHTMYILLIFFNITKIESKRAIAVSAVVTMTSFVKFVQLILVESTFANLALMVFFGSVQLLVVVVGIFLKIYQEETQKTRKLYEELLQAHNQLKVYADEIKDLSQIEARTMIARDLHDTLGHELTGLIMQMEMADGYYEKGNDAEGHKLLSASKQSARESLARVRRIVETLKSNEEVKATMDTVEGLMEEFSEKTGLEINYIHKGSHQLTPEQSLVLYRVVQECLTNAVRHGHASAVKVIMIYGTEGVDFQIEDNGTGCDSLVYNNGIKGMKDRLLEVGGTLSVEGKPVFKVWGRLPYLEG